MDTITLTMLSHYTQSKQEFYCQMKRPSNAPKCCQCTRVAKVGQELASPAILFQENYTKSAGTLDMTFQEEILSIPNSRCMGINN